MFKHKSHQINSNFIVLIVLIFLISAGRVAYFYNNQEQIEKQDDQVTISNPKEAQNIVSENTETITNNNITSNKIPKESTSSQSSKSQTSTHVDVIEPANTSAHDLTFKQWCDSKKTRMMETLDATYNRNVASENSQFQKNLSDLENEYNNRGMLDSGVYLEAVASENTAHQQRLAEIDSWRKNELSKVDSTCL